MDTESIILIMQEKLERKNKEVEQLIEENNQHIIKIRNLEADQKLFETEINDYIKRIMELEEKLKIKEELLKMCMKRGYLR